MFAEMHLMRYFQIDIRKCDNTHKMLLLRRGGLDCDEKLKVATLPSSHNMIHVKIKLSFL